MTDPHSQATGHGHAPHVMSRGALLATAGALLALTAITVLVSRIHLGEANVVAALGIACLKATLVALFFMHLKYEHRFFRVILVGSAVFAILLVVFVVFDTTQYQDGIRAVEAAKAGTR
jgi:cytochrome c oxidase subunit IV